MHWTPAGNSGTTDAAFWGAKNAGDVFWEQQGPVLLPTPQ